jgi:hypothetical protein
MPGQEKPLFMSTELGGLMMQFKSFGISSMMRTTAAGLQQRDAGVLMGVIGMLAAGVLIEQMRIIAHGKQGKNTPKTQADWINAGISNSGLVGWLYDADSMLYKSSFGTVGLQAMTGSKREISKYASQNLVGAMAGPAAGMATDVIGSIGAATHDLLTSTGPRKFNEASVHGLLRQVPYNNLFYLSRAVRALEGQAIDAAGIPRIPHK